MTRKNYQLSIFHYPFSWGYTLIEVMVVVTLMGLLVGGGIAAMTSARQKQILKRAGSQLYSDLRLAQARASAGDKPSECLVPPVKTLDGYRVKLVGTNQYQIVGVCSGEEYAAVTRTFPSGVTSLPDSTKCDTQASFLILGGGATGGVFCMQYNSRYYKVTVTSGGEVIDMGFVTSEDI